MKHMTAVGIRALKQNASAVVRMAAGGESIIITERGREVAQVVPLPATRLDRLIASGRARGPRRSLDDLPEPHRSDGDHVGTTALTHLRDDERY